MPFRSPINDPKVTSPSEPSTTTPSAENKDSIYDFDFEGFEQKARNTYQEKLVKQQKDAEALKNKSEYKNLTKTILTKEMFDSNPEAIRVEIDRLKKLLPVNQKNIKDYNNKLVTVAEFKTILEQKAVSLENKQQYEKLEASSAVSGSAGGPLGINPSESSEWQGRADLEALQRLIRARQENIADLESYIFGLVTGTEQFSPFAPTIAHTHAKFIKIAEEDMVKEADEEIEDYYNQLYQDSEGSPDYGTALEHPEETYNQLSTNIRHHRFKKK
jgi:hypothetical protein